MVEDFFKECVVLVVAWVDWFSIIVVWLGLNVLGHELGSSGIGWVIKGQELLGFS